MPPGGACPELADPETRADEQAVFWLPERCAVTVLLKACDDIPHNPAVRFDPDGWPGSWEIHQGRAGLFLLHVDGAQKHRLWLAERPPDGVMLSAHIPLDQTAPIRAAAMRAFLRHILTSGSSQSAAAAPSMPPKLQHLRLAVALFALDAHLAGANYREIAWMLYGPTRVADEHWKTGVLRQTVIRHVRRGRKMMHGGYLDLLTGARL